MKLKLSLRRMLAMCPEAWYIFTKSLQLCIALCICSVALLAEYRSSMMGNYSLYMLAMALNEISQVSMLLGMLVSFCMEALKVQGS